MITDDSVPGPQPLLGDKVITEFSVTTAVSPLIAPSPACEEIQKDLVERPLGDDHGSSENPLIGQMGSLLSPSHAPLWAESAIMRLPWKWRNTAWSQIQVQWWPGMSQGRRMEVRPHEVNL